MNKFASWYLNADPVSLFRKEQQFASVMTELNGNIDVKKEGY